MQGHTDNTTARESGTVRNVSDTSGRGAILLPTGAPKTAHGSGLVRTNRDESHGSGPKCGNARKPQKTQRNQVPPVGVEPTRPAKSLRILSPRSETHKASVRGKMRRGVVGLPPVGAPMRPTSGTVQKCDGGTDRASHGGAMACAGNGGARRLRPLNNTELAVLRYLNARGTSVPSSIVLGLWPSTRQLSTKVRTVERHLKALRGMGLVAMFPRPSFGHPDRWTATITDAGRGVVRANVKRVVPRLQLASGRGPGGGAA